MVFLYEEIDLTEEANRNQSGDERRITLFKAVMAREVSDRQVLMVTFDDAGRNPSVTGVVGYCR